jgi:hypothetical protein
VAKIAKMNVNTVLTKEGCHMVVGDRVVMQGALKGNLYWLQMKLADKIHNHAFSAFGGES